MREILCKGKRVDNGEWVEGYYVTIGEKYHYILTGKLDITQGYPEFEHFSIVSETAGRFTGLTDKNGTKIFEGDIIRAKWVHLNITDTVVGIVKFIDAAFVLETKNEYLFFEDNIFGIECEVIGNIHDNPELLENK